LLLPSSAVDASTDHPRVVLWEDGHAVSRRVEIGDHSGDRIEIKRGLDEHAEVIAEPNGIADGQRLTTAQ
jgi:hypothetical protein